jgi:hypothetical protein
LLIRWNHTLILLDPKKKMPLALICLSFHRRLTCSSWRLAGSGSSRSSTSSREHGHRFVAVPNSANPSDGSLIAHRMRVRIIQSLTCHGVLPWSRACSLEGAAPPGTWALVNNSNPSHRPFLWYHHQLPLPLPPPPQARAVAEATGRLAGLVSGGAENVRRRPCC